MNMRVIAGLFVMVILALPMASDAKTITFGKNKGKEVKSSEELADERQEQMVEKLEQIRAGMALLNRNIVQLNNMLDYEQKATNELLTKLLKVEVANNKELAKQGESTSTSEYVSARKKKDTDELDALRGINKQLERVVEEQKWINTLLQTYLEQAQSGN